MAVVNQKTLLIQNFEAKPNQMNPTSSLYGRRRTINGSVAVAADNSDGSTFMLAPIRSGWVVAAIRIYNTAMTASTSWNLGIYAKDGVTAVDAEAYASGVSLATANLTGSNQAFQNRTLDKMGQAVYQDAGLTENPQDWHYLALVGATIGTAAGTIAFDADVIID